MKANELRIGNYISRLDLGNQNPRVEKVLELLSKRAVTTGAVRVIVLYEDIKPILLTFEWFQKFGFTYDNNWHFYIGENSFTRDYLLDICWIDGDDFPFYRNGFFKIKYVHQLQNLYFALTGEELEIKNLKK